MNDRTVLAPFADPSVFFLLGGLFIGRAMSRHGLDRRLALMLLCTSWAGRSPATLLAAVGLAVTLISMSIGNTAACAMVCPVTLGIIAVLAAGNNPPGSSGEPKPAVIRPIALCVGVAAHHRLWGQRGRHCHAHRHRDQCGGSGVHGATGSAWSLGGLPQLVFARHADDGDHLSGNVCLAALAGHHDRTGHAGTAVSAPVRPVRTLETRRDQHSGRLPVCGNPLDHAGRVGADQPVGPVEFNRRLPEAIIALAAPILLFLLPINLERRQFTLEANDWQKLDWGTIILFGTALSLGGLMFRTGLAEAVGRGTFNALGTRNVWALTAVAIVAGILLSEFTSNTAAAAALLPVVHKLCVEAGVESLPPLLGVTFATSFGSCLPVSTPPNAIVYSTGLTPVRRMIRAGIGLDVVAGLVIWTILWLAWEWLHWVPLMAE